MTFEVVPYRDQSNRARRGFILRRADGALYGFGFRERVTAETFANGKRLADYWVRDPLLVVFNPPFAAEPQTSLRPRLSNAKQSPRGGDNPRRRSRRKRGALETIS